MLAACGLPTNLTDAAISDAFDTYRKKSGSPERAAAKADLVAKYGNRPVTIQMIGVWDTVGSLGIPSLIGGVDPLRYGFLDTGLSAQVKSAYHALAIDERRLSFPPTLWEGDPAPGQMVEQVWFTGCHSSVGGGCPDCGLSDITLKWMLGKCKDQGLEIDPGSVGEVPGAGHDGACTGCDRRVVESILGASAASAGTERLDHRFERCGAAGTSEGLSADEPGTDRGAPSGEDVSFDLTIVAGVRFWTVSFDCGQSG